MKMFRTFAFVGAMLLFTGAFSLLSAQVDDEALSEEELNSAIVYEFDKDFDVVFQGVQKGLVDAGYEVDYASKRKKLIETKFRILAPEDDFFDIMEQYGKIPYVRSPSWKNGRTLVSVRLEENGSGTTITVQAQLSAYEGRFLNKWLYWVSNGVLEEQALSAIVAAVDAESGSDL
ncbi:MAG: hypothetical protein KDD67_11605 [Ignavibacteriae bacterium]|nr:hypothetical protein [Ignavibacteriota bacterium]